MPTAIEPYIDAHSHIWTPDVAHYPLNKEWRVEDMQPRSFTAEELLAQCRPAGVGRVNLIQMSFYNPKTGGAKDRAEFDNSYMLDMIKLYPDRFVGTGIIDPFGAPADIEKDMKDLLPKGVRAFRIAPNYSKQPPSRWLQPEGYKTMFATAGKTRQVLSCLIDPDSFPEVDRMATAFPDTNIIIDHLGRIGVDGQVREKDVDALCALAKHPKMYVKVGAFYALGKKSPPYTDLGPMIEKVVQAYGAKRCMWESDCPFQVVDHKYAESVALIKDKDKTPFLTDDDRAWMLTKTAEGLLFWK